MAHCVQENCERELPEDAEYCVFCGAPQKDKCPNPRCPALLPLETTRCPNCRRLLRYCPRCRKLHLLDKEECTNTTWHNSRSALRDFYQGYSMAHVSAHRAGSMTDERSRSPRPAEPFTTLWTYREDERDTRISEVVTAYGRVFFVAESKRQLRSVAESHAVDGLRLGPNNTEVESSSKLDYPDDSQVREIMAGRGVVSFLAGPPIRRSPGQPPVYPLCRAFCLAADSLEIVYGPLDGEYQTHLVTDRLWLLARYDKQRNRSIVEAYSLSNGKRLFAHPLPDGTVIEHDTTPPVAAETDAYFATTEGVYRLPFDGGEPELLQWFEGAHDFRVVRMAYSQGSLRLLACDRQSGQNYRVFSFDTIQGSGIMRAQLSIRGIPHQALWLIDEWLYLYEPASNRSLIGYDIRNGFYSDEQTHYTFGLQENIQHLLPLRVAKETFVLSQWKHEQTGLIHFSLRLLANRAGGANLTIKRERMSRPGFSYSNGRLFVFDTQQGTLFATRIFEL